MSACPGNCRQCTVNTAKSNAAECNSNMCDPGYGLKDADKTCAECPKNCLYCVQSQSTSKMICRTCDPHYVLNSGDCGACPRYCLKCTEADDGLSCTQCKNRTVMMSDGTCTPCPTHCQACSQSGDVIKCNARRCDLGYGVGLTGRCEDCSTLNFANCNNCTDVSPLTGRSRCYSCSRGYALKDDNSTCMSCSSLSCAGGTCIDRHYVCDTCSNGYFKTKSEKSCGIYCWECPKSEKGCNGNPLTDNDTWSICPVGVPGVGCWMNYYKEGNTIMRHRGMRGQKNFTCTHPFTKDRCTTLQNGNKICSKCCMDNMCNIDAIALGDRVIASILVLIIMAFVAILM